MSVDTDTVQKKDCVYVKQFLSWSGFLFRSLMSMSMSTFTVRTPWLVKFWNNIKKQVTCSWPKVPKIFRRSEGVVQPLLLVSPAVRTHRWLWEGDVPVRILNRERFSEITVVTSDAWIMSPAKKKLCCCPVCRCTNLGFSWQSAPATYADGLARRLGRCDRCDGEEKREREEKRGATQEWLSPSRNTEELDSRWASPLAQIYLRCQVCLDDYPPRCAAPWRLPSVRVKFLRGTGARKRMAAHYSRPSPSVPCTESDRQRPPPPTCWLQLLLLSSASICFSRVLKANG